MAAVRSVMTTTRTHFLLLHNNKCSSSGCYFLRLNKAFASLCRWPSPKEKSSSSSSAEETLARRIASRGGSISSSSKEFSTREEGQSESLEYRIFFSDRTGRTVGSKSLACPFSFFHILSFTNARIRLCCCCCCCSDGDVAFLLTCF